MKTSVATVVGAALLLLPIGLAGAITLQVEPSDQSVASGSTVNAELVVSGLVSGAAPSLSTFDVDVTFDASILSFLGFTFGDPGLGDQLDLAGLGSITAAIPGPGGVNVFELSLDTSADLNALQAASFVLGTLRFAAVSTGVSAIGISVNALGDANGEPLAAEIGGGRVSVGPVAVPEPASLLLLLAGAVGCAAVRARQTLHDPQ